MPHVWAADSASDDDIAVAPPLAGGDPAGIGGGDAAVGAGAAPGIPAAAAVDPAHPGAALGVPDPAPRRKRGRPLTRPEPAASMPAAHGAIVPLGPVAPVGHHGEASLSSLMARIPPIALSDLDKALMAVSPKSDLSIATSSVFARCADRAFDPDKPRSVVPSVAEASMMGYKNSTYVKDKFQMLGCTTFFMSRHQADCALLWLLEMDDEDHLDLMVSLLAAASDETPMKLAIKLRRLMRKLDHTCLPSPDNRNKTTSKPVTSHAIADMKILQTELICAIGWVWKATGEPAIMVMELPTILQVANRMTGRMLFYLLKTQEAVKAFDRVRSRCPVNGSKHESDRGATNPVCNRIFRHKYPGDIRWDDSGCASHNVHTALHKLGKMHNSVYSGTISYALSQQQGGAEEGLRRSIQQVLLELVVPRVGVTPPGDSHPNMKYIDEVLLILCPGDENASRRVALRHYFRSDIQDPAVIDVYLPDMPAYQVPDALVRWSAGAALALYPAAIPVQQRHRWGSALVPLRATLLLDLFHDVKCTSALRFLVHSKGSMPKHDDSLGEVVFVEGAAVFKSLPQSGEATLSNVWAAMNNTARVETKTFCSMDLTTEEIIVVQVAIAGDGLMSDILTIDSSEWDAEQEKKAQETGARLYRPLEAHHGRITDKFFTSCRKLLFTKKSWAILPRSRRTLRARALAFASIARVAGAICFYIVMPWSGFPWKAFTMVDTSGDQEQATDDFLDACEFRLDNFAKDFRRLFPTKERLRSTEAQLILLMYLILVHLTISRVECRHAIVRRLIELLSSTWRADLAKICSDWVLQRQRLIQRDTAIALERHEAESGVAADAALPGTPRSHGGPCRAFFSEFWSSAEAQAIANKEERTNRGHALYRAIKAEGGERYQQLVRRGKLGTAQSANQSLRSFLPRKRPTAKKKGVVEMMHALLDGHDGAGAVIAPIVRDDSIVVLEDQLLEVRRVNKYAGSERRAQERAQREATVAWRESVISTSRFASAPLWSSGAGAQPKFPIAIRLPDALDFAKVSITHWCPHVGSLASKALANMSTVQRELVLQVWTDLSKVHLEEDIDVEEVPAPEGRPACFYAGFCVCNLLALRRCVSTVQAACRSWFPKGSTLLDILQMGMIVLGFRPLGSDNFVDFKFFHMSHEDRRTWRVCFMRLLLDDDEYRFVRATSVGQIPLVAIDSLLLGMGNLWRSLQTLDFDLAWECLVYEIIGVEGDDDGDWLPKNVLIRHCVPSSVKQVWDPEVKVVVRSNPHRWQKRRRVSKKAKDDGLDWDALEGDAADGGDGGDGGLAPIADADCPLERSGSEENDDAVALLLSDDEAGAGSESDDGLPGAAPHPSDPKHPFYKPPGHPDGPKPSVL